MHEYLGLIIYSTKPFAVFPNLVRLSLFVLQGPTEARDAPSGVTTALQHQALRWLC
jgi:hypothetical protein